MEYLITVASFFTDHWWLLYLPLGLGMLLFQYVQRWGVLIVLGLFLLEGALVVYFLGWGIIVPLLLYALLPSLFLNILIGLMFYIREDEATIPPKYRARLPLRSGFPDP
ncbi:hypothetical protein [Flagellimonas sp. MMG031]|uniref:Uncharacterized protein n=1 Tax=Flagellimonas sp. MMG031 TaxID=3158549 RepID=A0AAU7MX74_9FLAO